MDEALLTGRFSVRPDMTRRSLSAKVRGGSSPTAENEPGSEGPLSRGSSARPRSVSSRSSSRADTCLRRSRSTFDVELFRSQLRLNKSLSRNRFKQELLDLALHPIEARASSARAEPEGSELDTIIGSVRESSDKDGVSEKANIPEHLKEADSKARTENMSPAELKTDVVDGHDDKSGDGIEVNFHKQERLSPDVLAEDVPDGPLDGSIAARREPVSYTHLTLPTTAEV